jgi:hypothetical protein
MIIAGVVSWLCARPGPRRVLDREPIVEIDPKRQVLEQAGLNAAGGTRRLNGPQRR